MSNESKLPDFNEFSRWLAGRTNRPALSAERYEGVQGAARQARDEFIAAAREAAPEADARIAGSIEVLQLLAAADSDGALPPEIVTPKGFRITLAYEEGGDREASSIGVLVNCPPELTRMMEGKTVYLWSGTERFELGQFDAEGKALGTLPAGVEISASDFAQGKIRLEAPDSK